MLSFIPAPICLFYKVVLTLFYSLTTCKLDAGRGLQVPRGQHSRLNFYRRKAFLHVLVTLLVVGPELKQMGISTPWALANVEKAMGRL
jgi:hypothetical protein